MINGKKIIAAALIAVMSVMVFSSCAQNNGATSDKGYIANAVRINYTSTYGSAVQQIMKLNGRGETMMPEGVKIEWSNMTVTNDMRDALAAGQLDIAAITLNTVIAGIENGQPLVILSNTVSSYAKLYSNNPNINTLDEIKETNKIGINGLGTFADLALRIEGKDKYGDPNKFTNNLVNMTNADIYASLQSSKDLDCAILPFPNDLKVEKLGTVKQIFDLTPIIRDNGLGVVLVANEKFVKENPALVEAFMKEAESTIKFMNDKPEEAAKLLAGFYGNIDAADIEAQIKLMPPSMVMSESAYNKVASLMYEVGLLSNPPRKFSELPNYKSIPKGD